MADEGLTTASAPALAAAVALGTRTSKQEERPGDRFAMWAEQAAPFVDVERYVSDLQTYREPALADREAIIVERMLALPGQLTETESLFEQRHLLAAIGTALVGTGASAERMDLEAKRLIDAGRVIQLGRDKLGQPIYSTHEQIALERELLALTERVLGRRRSAPDAARVAALCRVRGLTGEQTRAALAATTNASIAVCEGAPGAGKSTLIAAVAAAYRELPGSRLVGTATVRSSVQVFTCNRLNRPASHSRRRSGSTSAPRRSESDRSNRSCASHALVSRKSLVCWRARDDATTMSERFMDGLSSTNACSVVAPWQP
ncbi:AAA family ATPase [Tardiphaga sp.]|uniref:AAA family ATPase n=1 Tax=Tardiphaga sp. TaxID=1926292 RepID=UPI00262FAD06|nr:AAA family ATPase [Tardiphaga sp.]